MTEQDISNPDVVTRSNGRSYPKHRQPNGSLVKGGGEGAYRQIKLPDHPLAMADGYVLEHRLVLCSKIGLMPTVCHHCGRTVDWFGKRDNRLVVDHLDDDEANNDPSNLVPSCYSCNCNRDRAPEQIEKNAGIAPDLWEALQADVTAEEFSEFVFDTWPEVVARLEAAA